MLVLSRKQGESIKIDDNITVTVVSIVGDKVRIGIDAPKDVPIHRQEIWDQIVKDRSGKVTHEAVRADLPKSGSPETAQ